MALNNPHDHFFRDSFTRPEIIHGFLEAYLPPDLLATLDLTSLTLEPESYIDEALRQNQTDLLYRIQHQCNRPKRKRSENDEHHC
jgi:predicted transposase/invertase (TIGR01784 family)